ncbi:hypothetical protein SH139x_001601 [Planctomycetaceae bacterium SH139]
MPSLTHLPASLFPPPLASLIASLPYPALDAGEPSFELATMLKELEAARGNQPFAPPQMAALWLLAGDLEQSHAISQSLDTHLGSFWHGVMHRREGDYGNAKYWFRRAGTLRCFSTLTRAVQEDSETASLLPNSDWDAELFVDFCQQAVRNGGPQQTRCELAQWREWQIVFNV